jgi:POT family proton-dependent oligopeptide transporter
MVTIPVDLTAPRTAVAEDTRFFGHPRGLATLFFTELWERFSYYGMRALLILFMTAPLATGGLAFDTAKAGVIYGTYTAFVYLGTLPGGWIADRFIGQRRATLYGGVLIMCGHISLAVPSITSFYLGLALIVVGTGLLKPNISTMVGQLYTTEDGRRDAGFSIFYMGINLGAFLSPLACGWLAQSERFRGILRSIGMAPENSWHFGFGMAAVGMFLGLVQYLAAALSATGMLHVTPERLGNWFGIVLLLVTVVFFASLFAAKGWTRGERNRLLTILVLFLAAAVFWSVFEQAGSTLNLFAQRNTDNRLFGMNFPASWFQSLNAIFIVMLAPVFAWLWVRLGRRNPSSPAKFVAGLLFVALGFAILIVAAKLASAGVKVSPLWLTVTYLLHTIGELCLSPVGLSAMSRLAPARVAGLMMGVWFLATSVGNYLGGQVASLYEAFALPTLFTVVTVFALVCALLLALLVRPIARMLAEHS